MTASGRLSGGGPNTAHRKEEAAGDSSHDGSRGSTSLGLLKTPGLLQLLIFFFTTHFFFFFFFGLLLVLLSGMLRAGATRR